MPCPRSYRWWAEGWETQPGDLRAEPPLATRVLGQRNKSGGFPGAVTWEAEGGTEHPWTNSAKPMVCKTAGILA